MAAQREVMRRDDPFGIPACFYWTVDEVADWIDSIGYGKYKENFRSHFINGRKLLTVDSCVLPKMGITHFGDILGLGRALMKLQGKGPTLVSWRPPPVAPHFRSGGPPQAQLSRGACLGADVSHNWRYWVPAFHYGYTPRDQPVTAADFQDRYDNDVVAQRLLGRHTFTLVRPP